MPFSLTKSIRMVGQLYISQQKMGASVKPYTYFGARTDLTDHEGRTPLDVAIDSAKDDFYKKKRCLPLSRYTDEENFDFRQAVNMRSHTEVADILLYRETHLTPIFDGRQTSLLHRAFKKEKPFIADRILSKSVLLNCTDREGRWRYLVGCYLKSSRRKHQY